MDRKKKKCTQAQEEPNNMKRPKLKRHKPAVAGNHEDNDPFDPFDDFDAIVVTRDIQGFKHLTLEV